MANAVKAKCKLPIHINSDNKIYGGKNHENFFKRQIV
jgi:hypothetical protein